MSENVEYIEKQTVRKIIEGWKPNEDDYGTRYDYLATFDLWDGCCCAITAAPAADVAPVVHGHWKKRYLEESERYDLECSKCGFRIVLDYYDIQYARYCNSCGAKMDEEKKEDDGSAKVQR